MKMTDLRAKARAIFGPAIAEPMPKQPNGAKALQQRANARPIPTYKVGGVVKKPVPTPGESVKSGNRMSKQEGDEMRFMDMLEKKKRPMPSPAASAASGNRMSRQEGAEMKKMKMAMGGKVQTSSDTARKLATEMGGYKKGGRVKDVDVDMKMLEEMSRPKMSLPNLESKAAEARNLNTARAKETSDAAKGKSFKEAFNEARKEQGPNGVFTWRGNTYNTKMAGESSKAAPARAAAPAPRAAAPAAAPAPASRPAAPAAAAPTRGNPPAAPANKSGNTGFNLDAEAKKLMAKDRGLFGPPMNMEQAREAVRAEAARERTPAPSVTRGYADRGARVLTEREKRVAQNAATERARVKKPSLLESMYDMTVNPGYKKGGKVKEAKPKDGLAVMIAIGKPMKPTKKMNGGAMGARDTDMEASKVTREMAMGGAPMGYAAGGAGKMRKGMMPEKFAQGGAGKVRKGMMTPEGKITNAMNKMRGK
jgi:hypothetical protein